MAIRSNNGKWNVVLGNLHWPLIAGVQLLLILLCISGLSEDEIINLYFNIDYLYLPSFYTDIILDGHSTQGWSLTPNPYFFPDMFLYFIIFSIFPNIGVAAICYGFVQLLLIEIFFYQILKMLINDKAIAKQYFIFSVFFIQLFLIAGAIFKEDFTAYLILANSGHVGAILSGLISIYVFGKFYKTRKKGLLLLLSILLIVSFVSDRLFLIQTIAPLLLITGWYMIKEKKALPFLIILLSTIIAWYSFKWLRKSIFYIPDASKPPLTKWQSILNFIAGYKFMLKDYPFTRIIFILHGCMLIVSPFALIWLKKEQRPLYFTMVFAASISFAFPIVYGFFQAIDTMRYIIHSYIFFMLLIPVLVGAIIKFRSVQKQAIIFTALFTAVVVFYAFKDINQAKLNYFIHYKNPHILLIEEHNTQLKNGIGGYLEGKNVYLFGSGKHRVVSVRPDFEPFIWQANRDWYIGAKDEIPIFNFALDMRPDSILGPPLDSIVGRGHQIFIYPDFCFKKVDKTRIMMFLVEAND